MFNQYFRERCETEIWAGITLSLALFFSYHAVKPFNVSFPQYNNKALLAFKTTQGIFQDQLSGGAKGINTFSLPLEGVSINPERTSRFSSGSRRIDLEIIKKIESDGNALAFNERTKCYGLYQISQVCLEDFNQVCEAAYTTQDLFDPVINEKIARWYFRRLEELLLYFKIPVSGAYLIASYNWGVGNVVRWHRAGALIESLPQETRNYIEKYKRLSLSFTKNS